MIGKEAVKDAHLSGVIASETDEMAEKDGREGEALRKKDQQDITVADRRGRIRASTHNEKPNLSLLH